MKKTVKKIAIPLLATLCTLLCVNQYQNVRAERLTLLCTREIFSELTYYRHLQKQLGIEMTAGKERDITKYLAQCQQLKEMRWVKCNDSISYIFQNTQNGFQKRAEVELESNFLHKDWLIIQKTAQNQYYEGVLRSEIYDRKGNVIGFLEGTYLLPCTTSIIKTLKEQGTIIEFTKEKGKRIPFSSELRLAIKSPRE